MFSPPTLASIRKRFGAPTGVAITPGTIAQGGNQGRMQDMRRTPLAKLTGGLNMKGSPGAPGSAGAQPVQALGQKPAAPQPVAQKPVAKVPSLTDLQTPKFRLPALAAPGAKFQDGSFTFDHAQLNADMQKAMALFQRGVADSKLNYGMGREEIENATLADGYADHGAMADRGIVSGGAIRKMDLDRLRDRNNAMQMLEAKFGKDALRQMIIDRDIELGRVQAQNLGIGSSALDRYNEQNPATPQKKGN